VLCTVTYLKSPQKVRQVDNVLIDAGSRIEAGSQMQAGVFRSLVLIEAGGFYLRFYGRCCHFFAVGVSEQFLNGTSAQLGYTVPFKLDVVKKI